MIEAYVIQYLQFLYQSYIQDAIYFFYPFRFITIDVLTS